MAAQPHTPWSRTVVLALALPLVVGIVVLAFLWPAATSDVRSVPVALVAPAAQAEQIRAALDERAPDAFAVTTLDDRDAAVAAIESREVYGAIVLVGEPEVLTASAASPVVAQLLSGLAPVLQGQLTAAAIAQGAPPTTVVTVTATDVVPLSDTDPRGSVLAASSFPIVLGGILGGILISIAVVGVWRRVAAVIVYSAVGGLVVAAVLQGVFGALQRDFLINASALSLALLAIGGFIVGAASLLGRPGIALGPVLFLLIANPISAAAQPVEFLASPWGAIGQWFPPGATATLVRDLSYFPLADASFPWLVLVGWASAGLLLALMGHFRQSGAASRAALAEATD